MFAFMIGRRNWALRLSVVLNVCVLLYVCAHFGVTGPWLEENTSGWSNQLQIEIAANQTSPKVPLTSLSSGPSSSALGLTGDAQKNVDQEKKPEDPAGQDLDRPDQPDLNAPRTMTLQEAVSCTDKPRKSRKAQRGDYWVLYNYVPMNTEVRCWETVTYTTHADYTFLDNLEPLLERWQAPVSIALHAPGTDFQATVNAIKYARNCLKPMVAQLVTFHVYFSSKHMPKMIPPGVKVANDKYNCSLPAPWFNTSTAKMYKTERKILYPVNVGRNIARESSPTHYFLASDIELYPSPDLPAKFLEMIRRNDQAAIRRPNPKVFVLSIFEVDEKSLPPDNKTALIKMMKKGSAIPFHKKVCSSCHNVPKSREWLEAPETTGMHVFHIGKRIGVHLHWEPIYIGTNDDPLYDERLSWEGKSDKMTQGYILCVQDYDFLILDNAFLVHRPGIKIFKKDPLRDLLTMKTNALIKKIILPELKILYGARKGCVM